MKVLQRYIAPGDNNLRLRREANVLASIELPYSLTGDAELDHVFPFAIPLSYGERTQGARAVDVFVTFSGVDHSVAAPEITIYAYAIADLKETFDDIVAGQLSTVYPWTFAIPLRGSAPNGNTDSNEVARTLESGGEPDSVCAHFFNKGSATPNLTIGAKNVIVRIEKTAGDTSAGTLDSLEVIVSG